MGIELGYDLIKNALLGWMPFDISWALPALLTILTLMIITGDRAKWKELALPVLIGWHVSGVRPHYLMYVVTGIIFVLEHMSISQLGEMTSVVTKAASAPFTKTEYQKTQDSWMRSQKQKTEQARYDQYLAGKMPSMSLSEIKALSKAGLTPKKQFSTGGAIDLTTKAQREGLRVKLFKPQKIGRFENTYGIHSEPLRQPGRYGFGHSKQANQLVGDVKEKLDKKDRKKFMIRVFE